MIDDALPLDRRPVVVLLFLAIALSLVFWPSGGAIPGGDPQVSANVSERYRSIDSLTATRSVVIRENATTTHTVADVTLIPGTDRERIRFRDGGPARYERRISNGSVLWLYDSDRQNLTVVELAGTPTAVMPARIQRLVAAAGLTDAAGQPQQPTVAPLPVVPRGSHPRPEATRVYRVEYVETAPVGDRTAYVLSVAPATNRSDVGYRQRLWIDTERFYPLRTQTTWNESGTRRSVTTTYTNVTFDTSISAGTFRPDVGSNVTINRLETPDTEWYRSVDRLTEQTTVTVPQPSVPPAFSLTYATRTTGRVQGVGLRYTADGRRLTAAKYNFTYALDEGEADLSIDGQPATLDRGPTTSLSWSCEQYRYTVRGTGVEIDQLVDTGRSIGCPAS
ncbi:MAG: outer membrane lipoprotein carrier protein LolA [Halobellus sp.]|uniref:outer membrane lipoprotein carrier protein LolA n=1 Tax=Halobellus sp. TaxID=1979212 RepID=UPI0035D4A21F